MITISAKELYKAAKAVKSTECSNSIPWLNYALVRLTDDGMIITTAAITDNKFEPQTSAPVRYWSNGERWETCIPMVHYTECHADPFHPMKTTKRKFYPFLDWLRVMADYGETLTMEFNPALQLLTVCAGSSRTQFKCIDAAEYPPFLHTA